MAKKVVVIGGGWAGFSAADAISSSTTEDEDSIQVELLDASPRGPGGLAGGWRTPKLKKPVEAGIHGFWREYTNTFAAIERLGLDLDQVLTPYTPSILVSQSGRVALAPVLGDIDRTNNEESFSFGRGNMDALFKKVADLLPPPLDVALLSEFAPNSPLKVEDRLSALGLLGIWADFEPENPSSWAKYDKISADSLFRATAGVSPTLYQELVSPLLHVLPMTPGYDCSAAAALSCFHAFALQARGAFDVRWCRGTISERIFNPWVEQLQSRGNVRIRGASKVTSIEEIEDRQRLQVTVNENETINCDAIVLAVGATSAKTLLASCPPLAAIPQTKPWQKCRGVTCVAVRLFLRSSTESVPTLPRAVAAAMEDSPVVVCGPNVGNIPELCETGFCIYDLQRLQDEFTVKDEEGEVTACLEVDFFRADKIADIEDDTQVAKLTLSAISSALEIDPIDPNAVLDLSVVRARNAVSHFCVDSTLWSPDVRLRKGIYVCGDWIDRTGHGSWSTEKAVVTGRQAAGALGKDFGIKCDSEVIPTVADTPQLAALRQVARVARNAAPVDAIPASPWVLFKQLIQTIS